MLFEFFLGTGLREQEVMYSTWKNVAFGGNVIAVRSRPGMGFKIKEERSVPVPDSLKLSLAERKRYRTSMLLFPGKGDRLEGHFLRILQKLALCAGLNCGECVTKKGKSCETHAVCRRCGLHKFRKTSATMHRQAGVSLPTLQKWLGHANLGTTTRYTAVADLRSERTRTQVNTSLAMLQIGGAA
jgi:integrase/recombinase XerD